MKKLFILILFISLFSLIGCIQGLEDFELINNTEYDVTLIDYADADKPEYFVPKNSIKHIEHYPTSDFRLKDNTYPIVVKNGYTSCRVENITTYDLLIDNQTNKEFTLIIDNDYQGTYTILQNQKTPLKVYTHTVNDNNIYLLYLDQNYDYYMLQNNKLFIF